MFSYITWRSEFLLDIAGPGRIVFVGSIIENFKPNVLVGYGPNPNECVAKIRALSTATVLGNHDVAAIDNTAQQVWAILCTRCHQRILSDGDTPPGYRAA